MDFIPATADQLLALKVCAGIDELAAHPRFEAATPDLVEALVEGNGQFAAGEFAPLNRKGDLEGAKLANGTVSLPDGFRAAYQAFVEQGWNSTSADPAYGGQGLPFSLAANVLENLGSANLAFSLLPMLTVGAIEALGHYGSPAQKDVFLPKLISGEWTGTMNLTEPQAGSDVGALRTTATPIAPDRFGGEHTGKYAIKGTKIFITWGEHDLAPNIVHLVLARTTGAPAGTRGISLFLVPKFHVDAEGRIGARNDLRCAGLEHKMGIMASPTCVMSFGDNDECIGELIGRENEGLKAMFAMMNSARINVGGQGVEIAERAWQQARTYARERVQGTRGGKPVAIAEHPDVRRMLLRMRALTEGARALLYYTAGQVDRGSLGDGAAQARADVLVPLLKAWGTDVGCEVASLGVQIHGGMGFVEETGAAQHYRDARIAPIYEGTNGIQAADLVTRKLGYDNGAVVTSLLGDVARECTGTPLAALAQECIAIAEWMRDSASIDDRLAGSVPFLTMCAVAVAGWQLQRQVAAAQGALAKTKPVVARWFAQELAEETRGLKAAALAGAAPLYELDAETLAA
jgi:alkylation response protein AidB-like acyl-CoA dehydrogenase